MISLLLAFTVNSLVCLVSEAYFPHFSPPGHLRPPMGPHHMIGPFPIPHHGPPHPAFMNGPFRGPAHPAGFPPMFHPKNVPHDISRITPTPRFNQPNYRRGPPLEPLRSTRPSHRERKILIIRKQGVGRPVGRTDRRGFLDRPDTRTFPDGPDSRGLPERGDFGRDMRGSFSGGPRAAIGGRNVDRNGNGWRRGDRTRGRNSNIDRNARPLPRMKEVIDTSNRVRITENSLADRSGINRNMDNRNNFNREPFNRDSRRNNVNRNGRNRNGDRRRGRNQNNNRDNNNRQDRNRNNNKKNNNRQEINRKNNRNNNNQPDRNRNSGLNVKRLNNVGALNKLAGRTLDFSGMSETVIRPDTAVNESPNAIEDRATEQVPVPTELLPTPAELVDAPVDVSRNVEVINPNLIGHPDLIGPPVVDLPGVVENINSEKALGGSFVDLTGISNPVDGPIGAETASIVQDTNELMPPPPPPPSAPSSISNGHHGPEHTVLGGQESLLDATLRNSNNDVVIIDSVGQFNPLGPDSVVDLTGTNFDMYPPGMNVNDGNVDVVTLDNAAFARLEQAIAAGQEISASLLEQLIGGGSGGHGSAGSAPGTAVAGTPDIFVIDASSGEPLPAASDVATKIDIAGSIPSLTDIAAPHAHGSHSPVGKVGAPVGSIAVGEREVMSLFSMPGTHTFPDVPASVSSIPKSIGQRMHSSHGAH